MMNVPPTAQVNAVERLLDLDGIKCPKPLSDALACFHAVREPEAIDIVAECQSVTAENVPELLDRVAFAEAMRQPHGQARGQVLDALARRVTVAAGAVVDDAAAILAARFDETADRFVAILDGLPDTHILDRADVIAQRGTATLNRWGEARDLATVLDDLAAQRESLVQLGYVALLPGVIEHRTRFAACADADAFDALAGLVSIPGFGPWPVIARIPGVRMHWMTPTAQVEQAHRVETEHRDTPGGARMTRWGTTSPHPPTKTGGL